MDPEVKEFDIDAGVDAIADGMGFDAPETETVETPLLDETVEHAEQVAIAREAPKSWAKEKHEIWATLPPAAQDQIELREKQILDGLEAYKGDAGFGKQLRDVMTPYKAMLQAQGVDETKAVQVLMNAHYKLSTLPMEQRVQFLTQLAHNYGIGQLAPQGQQEQVDPALQKVLSRQDQIEAKFAEEARQKFEATKAQITSDVMTFADAVNEKGEKIHPHFDEVADDIIANLNAGAELQVAYDKAVWANPVTRAAEIARFQTEAEAKRRGKHAGEAEAARKAASANVRSRATSRAPTEPLGKMEDTMKDTYREINSRAH